MGPKQNPHNAEGNVCMCWWAFKHSQQTEAGSGRQNTPSPRAGRGGLHAISEQQPQTVKGNAAGLVELLQTSFFFVRPVDLCDPFGSQKVSRTSRKQH